jgi:MHS family proline/betaine transporter-like MFS transporter
LHRRHVSKERENANGSELDQFGRHSPLLSNQQRQVRDSNGNSSNGNSHVHAHAQQQQILPQRQKYHDSFPDGVGGNDHGGGHMAESDGLFSVPETALHVVNTNATATPDAVIVTESNTGDKSDFWQTIAGIAGNVLEWYDFAVFGYLGDVIGEVFFPPKQPGDDATIEAFAVFGGAFLMRPIGGMMLGYIGDVYGRKRALVISIFLMAFPTFAMGCLPTYAQVGPFAIVLLTIVRLLQGISVGGQLMSSLVFTLENHDPKQWGLYGSFVMAAANFGTLLGGLVGSALRAYLTHEQLVSWGWRIPFLSGIVVSFSGFYLRSHGEHEHEHGTSGHMPVNTDSDVQDQDHSDEHHFVNDSDNVGTRAQDIVSPPPPVNPLRLAFAKGNRRALAASAMVPMLWSAGFYLCFVWMAIYMNTLIEDPVPNALAVNSAALLVSVCLFFPVAGSLSDRYGRRRIMTIGGVGVGVLGPLAVMLIGRGNALLAFLSQSTIGIAVSFFGAPMCAWLVESFDPASRLTSVAIGYNLAQATVGGITPALATFMVGNTGANSPGWILTGLAIVSMSGLWFVAPPPPPSFHDGLDTAQRKQHFVAVATEASTYESEMVVMPKAGSEDRELS